MEWAEAFRTGGIWMYLLLVIAIFGISSAIFSCLAMVFVKRSAPLYVLGGIGVGLAVLALFVGALGYSVGMMRARDALARATPDNRVRLEARGKEIALYPMRFGGMIAPVSFVTGAAAIAVGVRRR